MFVIRLYCRACSFETENISTGYSRRAPPVWFACYQHRETKRFRYASFSDARVREHLSDGASGDFALEPAFERLAAREAQDGEMHLALSGRIEGAPTAAICPECGQPLSVHYTGLA